MKLIDLSQPWGANTPPFPGQSGPVIQWEKRLSSDRVNVQRVDTTLHVGTHLDAPLHFISGGKDIDAFGLDRLFGVGIVADVSDIAVDYGLITPEAVRASADIRPGDILFLHTGYHRYAPYGATPDEERYFVKHPGPSSAFAEWALTMQFRLLGIDASSMDHPMNTVLRRLRPDLAHEAEAALECPLDEVFPPADFQCMHRRLFPHDLVHVENLGGDVELILNERTVLGVFPSRFRGGEAAMCRAVAFVDGVGNSRS
jgi:arylformamidase